MRILFTLSVLLLVLPALAQTEFSLYRLNANLPQANMLNPAFAPNSKLTIGLPLVSSIYAAVDNDGIAFRDVFMDSENDSLKIDTLSIFSKLNPSNRIQVNEAIQLFYLGLRGRKGYLSFAIHQVLEMRFNYPGDLAGWAIRGPAHPAYVGRSLDLSNFYSRSVAYNKVSLNYARDITPELRVGARFNYLLGVAAGESTSIDGRLTVNMDSVNIRTGDIHFQTAGIDFFDQDNLDVNDYKTYFLGTKNKGMSWDIGATYEVTNNLTVSAAINDLGYINWKEYTRSYRVAPVNYTFKGFDMLDYINKKPGDEFLQAEADSLENLFTATETTGNKFKTSLIGKFYAGVNFRLLRVNNFSALVYMDVFHKKVNPALSLGYNLQLGRLLNTTVGITYQNGSITNIGAGIALKLTHMQFYATSDRANSFIYPARASRADAHIGMNLVFGRPKKNRESSDKDKDKDKEEEPEKTTEEPKPDTVAQQPPAIEHQVPVDTSARATAEPVQPQPVVTQEETKEQVTSPPVETPVTETPSPVVETKEQPVQPAPEPAHETVKRGTHRDELSVGHYVVVGAFRQKENAERYSRMLRNSGYNNSFGFVTVKNVYYVHVFQSGGLDEARSMRDEFRKRSEFQFAESWVLSVE